MIGIFMNYKIILSVMPTYLASNINAHHILIPLNYFLHKMKKNSAAPQSTQRRNHD